MQRRRRADVHQFTEAVRKQLTEFARNFHARAELDAGGIFYVAVDPAQHAVDRKSHRVAHRHDAHIANFLINAQMRDAHETQARDRDVDFFCRHGVIKCSKLQHPSSREIPSPKLQKLRHTSRVWNLKLGASLELGCWSLDVSS